MASETKKRPGLVTLAAIMLFIVAGMHVVTAIELMSSGSSLNDVSFGLFGSDYVIWGIIDLILAALVVFAGVDVLRGGTFGRWVGVIIASLSAIRSFWFIWWAPLAAVLIIAIDIFVIYGLIMHSEYFNKE